jgi:multicomponent K+:H+ antiporter subunit D
LVVFPVILPLIAGLTMLLFDGRSRTFKAIIGLIATILQVAACTQLIISAASSSSPTVYLLGNWPAPFAIALLLDELSALMVMVTSILALAVLVFAIARWHRAGVHFHPLFQFLVMGLNGAFLTGDLFNLFVFFEVMLAASYGLVLHGSGVARIKAGLHFVAINLTASFLFLIGVSLIYGAAGTLNMVDLAVRLPSMSSDERSLVEAATAILGVAFLIKAGMWPLGFWLPTAYTAAAPPVSAILAITSKVGVYIILRLSLLVFGAEEMERFGTDVLLYGGLATIIFGMAGALAAQDAMRIASFTVLISSGTVLAAFGTNQVDVTAGALFYLVSSTLAVGSFFLLIELIERGREFGADMLALTREAFGDPDDPDEERSVGVPLPATMAMLSLAFVACATILAGIPPLSGFLGKFALMHSLFRPSEVTPEAISPGTWMLVALLILSSLALLIALARAGIRSFWTSEEREVPRISVMEMLPVAGLLLICIAMTTLAGPAMNYMKKTALSLHSADRLTQSMIGISPSSARAPTEASP